MQRTTCLNRTRAAGGPFERGQHVPLDAVALLVAQPEIDLRQVATIYAVGRNGGNMRRRGSGGLLMATSVVHHCTQGLAGDRRRGNSGKDATDTVGLATDRARDATCKVATVGRSMQRAAKPKCDRPCLSGAKCRPHRSGKTRKRRAHARLKTITVKRAHLRTRVPLLRR